MCYLFCLFVLFCFAICCFSLGVFNICSLYLIFVILINMCLGLNAEFQKITRRDEKAFLGDQCKGVEENNRMGKTRDLFKKIRDTKGTFNAKIGSIKDRNCMDLTEAEDIKERWQEYRTAIQKRSSRPR